MKNARLPSTKQGLQPNFQGLVETLKFRIFIIN